MIVTAWVCFFVWILFPSHIFTCLCFYILHDLVSSVLGVLRTYTVLLRRIWFGNRDVGYFPFAFFLLFLTSLGHCFWSKNNHFQEKVGISGNSTSVR